MGGVRPLQGWAELIRGAPLGVVVVGSLLLFLGAGLVLGGFYLALARPDAGWMPWILALGIGPTALYLALHLLRRTSWAWLALVALLALLAVSSLVRLLNVPGPVLAPLAELSLEALLLVYFARPTVRRAFGWS